MADYSFRNSSNDWKQTSVIQEVCESVDKCTSLAVFIHRSDSVEIYIIQESRPLSLDRIGSSSRRL